MQTRCLSFHADYRCRHTGECCRAGWDVEVEPHIVEAVRGGRVLPLLPAADPFVPLTGGPSLAPARTGTGDCGFHRDDRCSLHQAGESMLPSACRHFPRVFLRDARGTLLTLSHFCPTAASLLLPPGDARIVQAHEPLALAEPIEGLDARDALPPLVRPGLLADMQGYAAWEEAVVRTFADAVSAESALAVVDAATERVRGWRPSEGLLADAVVDAFSRAEPQPCDARLSAAFSLVLELTGPHPLMAVPATFEADWVRLHSGAASVLRGPAGRYLAASAFGNWIAYRGQGLRSIVAWLRAGYDVLRLQLVRQLGALERDIVAGDLLEPIRLADYIMIHTVDSQAFGAAATAFEGPHGRHQRGRQQNTREHRR